MRQSNPSRTVVLRGLDISKLYTGGGNLGPRYVALITGDIDALWLGLLERLLSSGSTESAGHKDGDGGEHGQLGKISSTDLHARLLLFFGSPSFECLRARGSLLPPTERRASSCGALLGVRQIWSGSNPSLVK